MIIRIFIALFLFISFVNAKDIDISFKVNKNIVYQGESVILDVNLSQLDESKVMLFNFSIKKSKEYRFKQVDFREDNRHHNLKQYYRYLIYPISSGSINIEFNMIKSITDDEKVAYSISGDRDNVKGLVKTDTILNIKPISLEVKKLANDIDFVGEYQLDYTVDKMSAKSYEPINLKIQIKGSGMPIDSFDILKDKKNYKIFKQKPLVKTIYTKDKSTTTIEWNYAISSKKSFTLERVKFKLFNPKTHKIYSLNIPQLDIDIKPTNIDNLVDKIDMPQHIESFKWDSIISIVSYILVFLAGFLTPKDIIYRFRYRAKKRDSFEIEIDRCKSSKELLALLLAQNNKRYSNIVNELESNIYQNIEINLKELKKRVKIE